MSNSDSIQVWVYSKDASNDKAVREVAGREDFGSGYGHDRDISFFATDAEDADNLMKRFFDVPGVKRVEIIHPNGRFICTSKTNLRWVHN